MPDNKTPKPEDAPEKDVKAPEPEDAPEKDVKAPEPDKKPDETGGFVDGEHNLAAKSGDADPAPVPESTLAEKLATDVESLKDAGAAVETVVTEMASQFHALAGADAAKIEELAEQYLGHAAAIAKAALANVEGAVAAGFQQAAHAVSGLADAGSPNNEHAVRSAVAHGMDEGTARAMTTHGTNL